jgi:hypothetical protein
VYFSGHGGCLPGDPGDTYLMPIDGAWGSQEQLEATAISGRLLGEKLSAIRAERLTVILDCCHAAGLAQARDVNPAGWVPELADDALGRLAAGRGRVVMAAARNDGSAYVMTGARYGLFTEHLIAGLRGAAGGADGLVRVLDLYHHVQRNVVARNPSAWARSLIRLLEERGVRVCTEAHDAELGDARVRELERLVSTSRFTLPVLTPRFSTGRFQELQTVMALHLGVEDGRARLIPIVREPCEARLGVRMLVHLDMVCDENVVPGIERLVRVLRKHATARSTPG